MHRLLLLLAALVGAGVQAATAADRPEIFVQMGHGQLVRSVAYSADGRYALSGSWDNNLKLWEVATGREVRTLSGHTKALTSVAISPDGRHALSGSYDQTIRLWDLSTGRVIRTMTGDPVTFQVDSVAFSPDGRTALSGGSHLVLWNLADGTPLRTLLKYDPGIRVQSAVFSPDGQHILTAQFTVEISGGWGLNPTRTSKIIPSMQLWNVASGEEVRTLSGHTEIITSVAFSPDGRLAVSGSADKTVMLWDLATGQTLRTLSGHTSQVDSVAFSPNGQQILSGSVDTSLKLWDVASGNPLRTFVGQRSKVTSVAFSPDGKQALSGGLGSVTVWNIDTGKEVRTLDGRSAPISSVAMSADGRQVVTAGFDARVTLWNAVSGKRSALLQGQSGIFSLALSPDGRLAATGGMDRIVRVWDIAAGKEVGAYGGHYDVVSAVAFSPDGKQILSGSWDKTLMLWDLASAKRIRTLTGHLGQVQSVAFSPDGKQAVSGDLIPINFAQMQQRALSYTTTELEVKASYSTQRFWDLASGKELRSIAKGDAFLGVRSVAYSPDGKLALSASYTNPKDGLAGGTFLKLIDVASGEEIRHFRGHTNTVNAVAFSPDGRQALSGGEDNTVKLWDVSSGTVLKTLTGHSAEVKSVRFSPDGRLAISGSADSTSRIWHLASGKEVVQTISFFDGEWLSITPEGYFSASSPNAAENLNIRMGMNVYGVEQFYDVFYRPDIVEAALAGKDTASMVALTIDAAIRNPPPEIERVEAPAASSAETVKISYRIKSNGGGIGDVRVFHNGKLVKSDGVSRTMPDDLRGKKASQMTSDVLVNQMRGLAQRAVTDTSLAGAVSATPKPDVYEAVVEIEPIPGENDISVIAFNAQNSIQSKAGTTSYTSSKPTVAPRLHILAVGIDEYKDKSARLNFAVKDARDIAARWKAQAANIYGAQNIFVETITNAQASREGVLAKINAIASRAKATDHFLLFVAAHGVLLGDQYYMVTNDYDGALQPSKLISANEIVDFSKRIKALSQLYILDTCHAGGMEGVVSGLYDARVSVLAKKMGLHLFASASSVEEALDGYQGNGLFTHTLLAGLNNNRQVDANADKKISLIELGRYSKAETKGIAQKMRHTQDPLIINFGQDNPVYALP